jgi:hypothetical protein
MLDNAKLWLLKKLTPKDNRGREFSQEDYDKSQLNRLTNKLKKERLQTLKDRYDHLSRLKAEREMQLRIEELEEEFDDDDEEDEPEQEEESMEDMALKMLMQKFTGGNPLASAAVSTLVDLEDNEIDAVLAKVPKKALDMFSGLDEPIQKKLIASHLPNISPSTVNKVLLRLQQ